MSAKEVEVEELTISLYNKPVTGFRFTLERSERFMANQIIEHVAAVEKTSPFQYERSIIYENIRYTPISKDRDLSLYFLLKSIQGQFTELTMIVMYDYRRSINSRDFPEMAMLLKIDLAKLIRKTSGDVARFGEMVLDDPTLLRMESNPSVADPATPVPVVEHSRQEEVDKESVFLRRDPFKPENKQVGEARNGVPDTTVQRLNARIQALEVREQELLATERNLRNEQATLQRQHDILLSKVKENKRLQDSVALLTERVEAMINQSYVADDVSVSNETAMEMAELEKENGRLTRQNKQLQLESDSLQKVANKYANQLAQLSAGGKTTAEQLTQLSEENKVLRSEVQAFKAKEAMGLASGNNAAERGRAVADSLLDLLAAAQVKHAALREEVEASLRSIGRLKEDNDYLNGKKMQLEERVTALDAENRSLRLGTEATTPTPPDAHLIDSLNGEIRTARRAAGTAKAEVTKLKTDIETLQQAKDSQERQLVAAQTQQKSLQARVAALEASQGATTPAHTNIEAPDPALADSVRILRQQLALADRRVSEAAATKDALNKIQAEMLVRERDLRKAQTDLTTRTTELAEAQKAKGELQKLLKDAESRLAENSNSKTASQQELDRLKQENRALMGTNSTKEAQLGKVTAENKSLLDSLGGLRSQNSVLERDIEARDRTLRKQIVTRDSLASQLVSANNREKDLKRNLAVLQSRVDSLARVKVPEGEQMRFLKEQRALLDQKEKDLVAREIATADKEKLIAQRESVLVRKEADATAQETRFKNLEERERRVLLLEQQNNNRENLAPVDANSPIQVREGRVVEFGNHIPVFIVESAMSYKAAQRQVVGYMISRDELYDDRFPELLYRAANLSELDAAPVEMKVRIDTRNTGCMLQISFRLNDGEYLGGEKYRERISAVKQLISKMLRYKV